MQETTTTLDVENTAENLDNVPEKKDSDLGGHDPRTISLPSIPDRSPQHDLAYYHDSKPPPKRKIAILTCPIPQRHAHAHSTHLRTYSPRDRRPIPPPHQHRQPAWPARHMTTRRRETAAKRKSGGLTRCNATRTQRMHSACGTTASCKHMRACYVRNRHVVPTTNMSPRR